MTSRNCTSYVLSESSLFVFENICIFKTCGRTLLLLTIPLILELLKEKGLQLEYLLYSSKNYLYPDCQVYPHNSWKDAVGICEKCDCRRLICVGFSQRIIPLFWVTALRIMCSCLHTALCSHAVRMRIRL